MASPSLESSNLGAGGLSVSAQRRDGLLVFTVLGEVDLASAALLEAELWREDPTDANMVVVDLAGVEFMDSSGLRVLLKAREWFGRSGRPLSLSRLSPQVRRLLEVTGTLGLFSVEGLRDASSDGDSTGVLLSQPPRTDALESQ